MYKLFHHIPVKIISHLHAVHTECLPLSLTPEQIFFYCPVNFMRFYSPLRCKEPCFPPNLFHPEENSEIWNLLIDACIVIGVDITSFIKMTFPVLDHMRFAAQ